MLSPSPLVLSRMRQYRTGPALSHLMHCKASAICPLSIPVFCRASPEPLSILWSTLLAWEAEGQSLFIHTHLRIQVPHPHMKTCDLQTSSIWHCIAEAAPTSFTVPFHPISQHLWPTLFLCVLRVESCVSEDKMFSCLASLESAWFGARANDSLYNCYSLDSTPATQC